jgi:hypothetical protein
MKRDPRARLGNRETAGASSASLGVGLTAPRASKFVPKAAQRPNISRSLRAGGSTEPNQSGESGKLFATGYDETHVPKNRPGT